MPERGAAMAKDKFQFKIEVEPRDIPNLDDSHKRDCADMITGIINSVFKYTMIFSAAVLVFFVAYSMFSFTYLLRMSEVLPQLSVALPVLVTVAAVLEFIAGTMQKWALIAEIVIIAAAAFAAVSVIPTIWVLPFALYAAFLHLKLLTLMPVYKALSEQPGFPEFTPLPSKDEIAVKKEEKTE